MKANKFFAAAIAALALVGFTACGDEPASEDNLTLDKTSVTLEVNATETINATVDAEWTTTDPAIATVVGNGKQATITAVAEGNAIISATTKGGQTKTCVVLVQKGGQGGETHALKGSQFWPIALDATTADANAAKMAADFRPDETERFLYVWDGTYAANDNPVGLNFHGNTDGFVALTVTTLGWAGCGYCLTANEPATSWAKAEELRAAIVADPDNYFLHMAIKSTDKGSHCFYIMGSEDTKFVLGTQAVYDGPVYADFTRDGSWAEFDIPMSQFATALANVKCEAEVNIFVALSEGIAGVQLNMDAIYFYKK